LPDPTARRLLWHVPLSLCSREVALLLPNGSRMVGLPGKADTVRGYSAVSLMVIDEAAWVCDEMYRAVTPMLAVGKGSCG
jgi:hypothetical protein